MATKRQPSKQRRQTKNQRQRAALEARRANAAAGRRPTARSAAGSPRRPAELGGGSLFSRLRGARATGRAIRTGGRQHGRDHSPPGYRAALSGLLAGVAAAIVGRC